MGCCVSCRFLFTIASQRICPTMSITAINVRNQFRGKVREIIEGPVVSEVDVETAQGLLVTSVITTRSVQELGLARGRKVIALGKSTGGSLPPLWPPPTAAPKVAR